MLHNPREAVTSEVLLGNWLCSCECLFRYFPFFSLSLKLHRFSPAKRRVTDEWLDDDWCDEETTECWLSFVYRIMKDRKDQRCSYHRCPHSVLLLKGYLQHFSIISSGVEISEMSLYFYQTYCMFHSWVPEDMHHWTCALQIHVTGSNY